jgi:hypothetical protein
MKIRVKTGRGRRERALAHREPLAFQVRGSKTVVFAWYTPESWARLRATADDPEALDDSYGAWLSSAEEALHSLQAQGVSAERFLLDVDAAAAWAKGNGEPFNSAARAAYVATVRR